MHGPTFGTSAAISKPAPASAPARPIPGKPALRPDEGGGLRVLTYLRLHWMMILFCGTLLGGVGAYAAWELLASKYESYALFQVSSVPTTLANPNNPNQARTDFVTYLKTTSALIKSEFVLNAALRDLKDVPTIKAQKDPIKFLDEEITVTWQDGSEVIRVSFKGHEPADAKRIVDAVQGAFVKEVVMRDVQDKQAFQKKVEDELVKMQNILKRKAESPALAKGSNPAAGGVFPAGGVPKDIPTPMPGAPNPLPPLAPGGSGLPAAPAAPAAPPAPPQTGVDLIHRLDPRILLNKVAGLQAEVERLPLTINDGRRRLALLQQKMDAIKNAPVSQATLDAVEKDQDVVVQVLKTKQAKREYDFKANSAQDKNAPAIVELRQAWEAHEARLAQMRKEKSETIERDRRVAEAQKIASEMEALISYLQKQQEQLETAKTLLAGAEKQLAELPLPTEKGSLLPVDFKEPAGYQAEASDLESTDGIYRSLVRQYYLTQMELNSPTRVRVLQAASNPVQKEMKKQIIGTVFAGLMGFGVMIAGVIGFETITRRVSSLADVKAASPMPVVGVIPHPTGRGPTAQAASGEAIDKLRAYVAQTWLARGASTVAVTSPLADEGKALAAFGLANSLARSGYRTLLVDFDLREPKLHELAGVPNGVGVCELLRAEIDPPAALVALPSGLHLVPAGKWSDEARRAATGERLEALLTRLKGPYDCVVLHAHALLTAAESVEAARRCEVVLICAGYRQTTVPLLKRAAERLAAMEVPYAGIVYVGATEQEALC